MNCLDCEFHKILPDPDPDDWFRDDDICVVCMKVSNDKKDLNSKWKSDRYEHKSVTFSCRPYKLRRETETPDWCPLKGKEMSNDDITERATKALDDYKASLDQFVEKTNQITDEQVWLSAANSMLTTFTATSTAEVAIHADNILRQFNERFRK
jgi:hypothetical protein